MPRFARSLAALLVALPLLLAALASSPAAVGEADRPAPARPAAPLPAASTSAAAGIQYGVLASSELVVFDQQLQRQVPRYRLVKDMGFQWVKLYGGWADSEASRGAQIHLEGIEYRVDVARSLGLKVLLIIQDSPSWANGVGWKDDAPPLDDQDLANFIAYVAGYFRGRIGAYEIWNEPNTRDSWGGFEPDAAKLARMMCAIYPALKQADPEALLISGGLANTGDGTPGNPSDLAYIQAFVAAGGSDCVDAVGVHPYGGPYPPEATHEQAAMGTFFRRAEEEHAVLVSARGGRELPLWATEWGYLVDPAVDGRPNCLDDHFRQMTLPNEQTQAQYLAGAYAYARDNWPWIGGVFFNSLDLNLDPWRSWNDCDPLVYLGITRPDGSLRPAYDALRLLPKFIIQNTILTPSLGTTVYGRVQITGTARDPDVAGGTGVTRVALYLNSRTAAGYGTLLGDAALAPDGGFSFGWDSSAHPAGEHRLYAVASGPGRAAVSAYSDITIGTVLLANVPRPILRLTPDGPTTATLDVRFTRNDGRAVGNWQLDPAGLAGKPWLSANLGGSGATPLRLSVDRTGLAPGWYQATLRVSTTDGDVATEGRTVELQAELFVGWSALTPLLVGR